MSHIEYRCGGAFREAWRVMASATCPRRESRERSRTARTEPDEVRQQCEARGLWHVLAWPVAPHDFWNDLWLFLCDPVARVVSEWFCLAPRLYMYIRRMCIYHRVPYTVSYTYVYIARLVANVVPHVRCVCWGWLVAYFIWYVIVQKARAPFPQAGCGRRQPPPGQG